MYKKVFQKVFPDFFGAQVIVFQGEKDYFVVIFDKDGINYYFVDNELRYMYPVSSYMRKVGFVPADAFHDTIKFPNKIELNNFGHGACPEWFVRLINGT